MRRILWVLSIFATIEALGIIISIGFSAQASGAQNQNWTNYNINATNAYSFWTIAFKDTEWKTKFVIMDRDLWATKAWIDSSAYWLIYQWGNNFGFTPNWNNKTSTGITIPYEDVEYGPKNPYYNDTIRLNSIFEWEAKATSNLRWWSWDDVYDVVKDLRLKQWPCPEGYHVPSNRERSDLVSLRWKTNKNWKTQWDNALLEKMRNDFQIPFTPVFEIKSWNGTYKTTDEKGNIVTKYWTSTPGKYQDNAYSSIFSTNKDSSKFMNSYTSRSTVLPIRCFKNTVISYKINFESNWWTKLESIRLDPWYPPIKPDDPQKSGFDFWWWYTDNDFKNKFDFYEKSYYSFQATWDLTLYAKWDAKIAPYITHKLDVTTYTASDDSFNVWDRIKPMWTITITNPKTKESITILDRNLWASSIATGFSSDNAVFQWGNNYGFNAYILQNPKFNYNYFSTVDEWANFDNYGPWNWYYSNTFRYLPNNEPNTSNWDYWKDSKTYPNLWWWGNDSLENWRWWTSNGAERQWPCPDWFHVPSAWEWNYLLDLWWELNPWSVDTWDDFFNRITNHDAFIKFQNELLIPRVDKIYRETKGRTVSSYWGYRSSSTYNYEKWRVDSWVEYSPSFAPYDTSWLRVNDLLSHWDTNVNMDGNEHISWNPIRCFADVKTTPLVTVKFITNASHVGDSYYYDDSVIKKQKVQYWWYAYEPEKPQKTWFSFEWWYKDKELTIPFNFKEEAITRPLTLYAKWNQNLDGNIWTITLTWKTWTSFEGKEITLLDRDLWASVVNGWDYYLFQRWNNHAFWSNPYGWEKESNELIEYKWYRPWNWYSSSIEVINNDDYWTWNKHYNNLWGWEFDMKDNNWWDHDLGSTRQWPCPDWFHIPSIWEWNNLLKMWHENEWLTYNTEKWWTLIKTNKNLDSTAFNNYFKLGYQTTYRSSSPYNDRDDKDSMMNQNTMWLFARVFTNWPIDVTWYNERTKLNNIRCFKNDTNQDQITFDTDWWSPVQPMYVNEHQSFRTDLQRINTPKKNWYMFIKWNTKEAVFRNWNVSYELFPFDIYTGMIDGDTTLYASWLKWWLRFGDDPKYKDNDKSIWTITLSNEDWSKKVTIMDKNIWAAFSWWGYYFPSDSSWKKYTKDNIPSCPNGYHIPSTNEWKNLLWIRCSNKWLKCLWLSTSLSEENINHFTNDLMFPRTWTYRDSNKNDFNITSYYIGYYHNYNSTSDTNYLRCFRDTPITEEELSNEDTPKTIQFTITFETNWWNNIDSIKTDNTQEITLPTPKKNNFTFFAWYLDKKFKNKYISNKDLTWDTTFYARWIEQAHVSYLVDPDYKNNWEDINVITITSKDWEHSISLMDRNLWANSNDSSNGSSYGCYYQRWNNYCFKSPLTKTGHTFAKYNNYGPKNWFNNDNFFIPADTIHPLKDWRGRVIGWYWAWFYQDADYWENEQQYPNLWWGGWELDWKWSLTKDDWNDRVERQGPCPDWYHIPSNWEWYWVTEIWWEWPYMIEHLKLPTANSEKNRSSEWILSPWFYWSSTPHRMSTYNPVNIGSYWRYIFKDRINLWLWDNTDAANIRCFRNEVLTGETIDEISVSFETNWWSKIEKISIKSGSIPKMPESPVKNWFIFVNWFTDTNLTKQYDFDSALSSNITLYAKWEKLAEEEYWETNANVSWTIIYNGVKMNTITVSYGNESITILDRNLGATKAWTGKDSYGYYFQWWNNHGFTEKDNITHTYNDHTYKGYGPVNPLDSDLFWWTYFDIWDNSKHFDFIWWWEKDNTSNNYNAWNVKLIENHTSRQWPCPEGFHIPSAGEWSKLLELWWKNNDIYSWKSDNYNLKETGNKKWIWTKLSNDLLLPLAWTISVWSWWDVSMSQVWETANLWTSSALWVENDTRENLSRTLYVHDNEIILGIDNRSDAQNIRCFKDTKLKTISSYSVFFDTNWWNHINSMTFTPYSNSVTIGHSMEEANGRYVLDLYDIEKYLVPIRTGYEFIGWHSDKELTKKFDFDTILTENIILYAKRSKSISHDTINWIDTITIYDYSSDKSITIMGNNLWANSNQANWLLYQWGNNNWFTEKQLETKSTTPIKYENYGPQKPYSSKKYVVPYANSNDYWENDGHYPNLWWGQWDTKSNNWDDWNDRSLRKWPCPDWFHVPSKWEWDELVDIWSKNNGVTWTKNMYLRLDEPAYKKIIKDLNLWSWYYYRTLRTSSPVKSGHSYTLWIVNDYTVETRSNPNNFVSPIRCFLNYSIKNDDENNLWDNLENSNDKNNDNKSVKYTVKHLTETLTWAYTLLSTETPTSESWSKVTPPVKKFKGYKSPNTKTITVKWDWTSVVEYRYSRELFEITLNKWEWIQTVAWGGSYRFWTKVSLSATPVPGYEFVGFEGDQTTWSFTMPSNNITITAKAKKGNTKYSISYNLNKWKLEQWKNNPTSYSSSSPSFTINPPVRNEYVFAWWEETVNWKVTWIKTYVSIPQWSTWHRKYSAKWKKEWEVEEMIYNQQEDLEGNYVTVEVIASDWDWDSDSWNWNTNWPREYEWFHLVEDFSKQNNIDQWAIWEVLELWSNWPATIIYRYARNSYTLTIEKDAWIELVHWAWTYKYQEPVSIKVKVKDWYQFAWFEWEYNVANFEMPAKNLTIKAITTKRK